MIYATGDTHGNFQRFAPEHFPEQAQMSRDDFMIICGDFGGVWEGGKKDARSLDRLENLPFTMYKGRDNMAELSPMMKQYLEIKEQNKDCILFFRLGDFYEMFFDDAKLASKELELTLTGRDCGLEERAPMCGVPFHSCEGYIARLVAKGYKVAICEQMEDP